MQNNYSFEEKRNKIIKQLRKAGIKVKVGKKKAENNQFSGIIGEKKTLRIK